MVEGVLEQNDLIVDKIIKTGKEGPVKALVGKVMKVSNRKGDPLRIKSLIEDAIE